MFSTFPFKLLHVAKTPQRAEIIAQIFAAAEPWSCVDKNVSAERLKGTKLSESESPRPRLWHLGCPAAVRAGWCKGILVPRPLLVSAVINSSILLHGTWTPSLIFLIDKTITFSLFNFWRAAAQEWLYCLGGLVFMCKNCRLTKCKPSCAWSFQINCKGMV